MAVLRLLTWMFPTAASGSRPLVNRPKASPEINSKKGIEDASPRFMNAALLSDALQPSEMRTEYMNLAARCTGRQIEGLCAAPRICCERSDMMALLNSAIGERAVLPMLALAHWSFRRFQF